MICSCKFHNAISCTLENAHLRTDELNSVTRFSLPIPSGFFAQPRNLMSLELRIARGCESRQSPCRHPVSKGRMLNSFMIISIPRISNQRDSNSEHGGCLQQKCLGKLLIFWDGFLSALCSALAACEVPFPRLCFPLASGFVLTSLMPPPPAALPLHSSSHEQTHLESCTSFASVRWHVCPRFVDSRFVTLTSCNPTRDSSTLSHIPRKRLMQGLPLHLGFSSFGFFCSGDSEHPSTPLRLSLSHPPSLTNPS